MALHTQHEFVGSIDRYSYDWQLISKNGWAQLDTPEDAHYLGYWGNPSKLAIVAYVEGDQYITKCDTREEWEAEILNLGTMYGSVRADAGWNNPELQAEFSFLEVTNA